MPSSLILSGQISTISICTIKAASPPPPKTEPLTPFNLCFLSPHYIQKGLLFSTPPPPFSDIQTIIHRLKSSLSVALHHFYPLSGRFKTTSVSDGLYISIDCSNQGVEFIHSSAPSVKVEQVFDLSFTTPLFPLNHAVNHDGHTSPLVAVQLTELQDGLFLACCFNHAVGDGTSYWHFLNSWAELYRSDGGLDFPLSRPPVHEKFFIHGQAPPVVFPYHSLDPYIERYAPPPLHEKIFHFTPESIASLKARANSESGAQGSIVISSFQSLSALMWRCITRARGLPGSTRTSCQLAIQDRGRLRPPLSDNYFGVVASKLPTTTTVGELMGNGLGWAGLKLNRSVAEHTDEVVRERLRRYHEKPEVYRLSEFDRNSIMMGSGPRFDMYGCDFGWGKAVGVRSGMANKFEGKVSANPGREGGGSVDLEVCLLEEHMGLLFKDPEFMDVVSGFTGHWAVSNLG